MLLRAPPPDPSSTGKSKLFISQPRRIAAKALVERLRAVEPDLRDQIALRMGHGVRGTLPRADSIYAVRVTLSHVVCPPFAFRVRNKVDAGILCDNRIPREGSGQQSGAFQRCYLFDH